MSDVTFIITQAPAAYDYEYVTEIASDIDVPVYEGATYMVKARLVLMQNEHVAYQTGRYESGMYMTRPITEADVKAIVNP